MDLGRMAAFLLSVPGGNKMTKRILPLVLLFVLVVVVLVAVERQSTRSERASSHSSTPAMTAQDAQAAVHSDGAKASTHTSTNRKARAYRAATTTQVTTSGQIATTTQVASMTPRERGVYRPNRWYASQPQVSTKKPDEWSKWVTVPGTGVALWPRPTG